MHLLTTAETMSCTNLSRRQIYNLRDRGRFPAPVKIAPNAIAYRADDVERWMKANIDPKFHFDHKSEA